LSRAAYHATQQSLDIDATCITSCTQLQWSGTQWMSSEMQLIICIQSKSLWTPLTSHYLPWPSKYSGNGQIDMVKLWFFLGVSTLRWHSRGPRKWLGRGSCSSRRYHNRHSWLFLKSGPCCSYEKK